MARRILDGSFNDIVEREWRTFSSVQTQSLMATKGFAQKVLKLTRFGFAAGCEAWLRHAGTFSYSVGLCPAFGLSPDQGQAQFSNLRSDGVAEPRLTSGGKAEATDVQNLY